ncbi:DUF4189 domain-containing protein [Rhizobium sp. BR 314]|uniref:DUF4189 domain-containing protein n=1 Tax=Rhizobium sp. BR 314 TaxID=3040013 RepID=UPI0039BFC4E9
MTRLKFAATTALLTLTMAATVASAAEFGALAYSRSTGSYGSSHNYSTRADAEDEALSNCSSYADDCRIVVYFRNACGALAVGSRRGFGYGWSARRGEARYTALANCRENDRGCRIVNWTCSK